MAGRENEEKHPWLSLPPDYVSLNDLRERWLKEKEKRDRGGGDPQRVAAEEEEVPKIHRENTASAVEANRQSQAAEGENGKRSEKEESGKGGSSGGKIKGKKRNWKKNKKVNKAKETLGAEKKAPAVVDGMVWVKKKVKVVVNPMAEIERKFGDFPVRHRKGASARAGKRQNRNVRVDRTAEVGLKIGDNSTEDRKNSQDERMAGSGQRIGNMSTVSGNEGEANIVKKNAQSDRTAKNGRRISDQSTGDVRDGRKYVDGNRKAENGWRIADISEKERKGDGARNIGKNVYGDRTAEDGQRIGDLSMSSKKGGNGRRNVRGDSAVWFRRGSGRVNRGKMKMDSSLVWVRKEEKSEVCVEGNCLEGVLEKAGEKEKKPGRGRA